MHCLEGSNKELYLQKHLHKMHLFTFWMNPVQHLTLLPGVGFLALFDSLLMLLGHETAWREWREALGGERMHHAWLLAGRRGLGKASFALAAARGLVAVVGALASAEIIIRTSCVLEVVEVDILWPQSGATCSRGGRTCQRRPS